MSESVSFEFYFVICGVEATQKVVFFGIIFNLTSKATEQRSYHKIVFRFYSTQTIYSCSSGEIQEKSFNRIVHMVSYGSALTQLFFSLTWKKVFVNEKKIMV